MIQTTFRKHYIGTKENIVLGKAALSKMYSMLLTAIIIVAAITGFAAYYFLSGPETTNKTIKIGLCADLDTYNGKSSYQEAILAVEQINAEGGVLGRLFEVVAEDDDSTQPDISVATSALTRLITVDKADYLITGGSFSSVYQELSSQHKKIMFDLFNIADESTQKVLDNYDKYKYYFRVGVANETASIKGVTDVITTIREYTGLNKVALVIHNFGSGATTFSRLVADLENSGIEVVYTAQIPLDTIEFSSYFAQAEARGAEMMVPIVLLGQAGVPFIREYYDRQSPMLLLGQIGGAVQSNFWELTEGKCEYFSCAAYPPEVGFPLTNKTLAFADAYLERWGGVSSGAVYDAVRYILPDAIRRAGTFETNAVIAALETVNVETCLARHFVFTASHDVMIAGSGPNQPSEDYYIVCHFQWQNGKLVPIYPKEIMEEAGASYKVPDWPGPWD